MGLKVLINFIYLGYKTNLRKLIKTIERNKHIPGKS